MTQARHILVVLNRILPLSHQIQEGILAFTSDHKLPWDFMIHDLQDNNLAVAHKWELDGCITVITTNEMNRWAKNLRIPVINTNAPFPTPRFVQIDADRTATGKMAAQYFLNAGFQQFTAWGVEKPGHLDRLRGFQKELEQHRRTCSIITHPSRDASFIQMLEARLPVIVKTGLRPIAAYFSDDGTAQMAVRTCKRLGISVPHDLAILGTENNTYICEGTVPHISSVRLPYRDIGYQASRLLHQLMRGQTPPHTTLLPPVEVIQRASTDVLAVPDEALAKALRYIREHAFEPLRMDEVARAAGIARRSMEDRFAKLLDCSPLEEVTRIRLEKAMHLLRNTRLGMDDIAEQCGLSTANYLGEALKKKTSLTPSAYRRGFHEIRK